MGELGADDRINLLMIIDTIRTALAMSEIHSDDYVLLIDELNSIKGALTKLEPHLGRFDASLHDVFVQFRNEAGLRAQKYKQRGRRRSKGPLGCASTAIPTMAEIGNQP